MLLECGDRKNRENKWVESVILIIKHLHFPFSQSKKVLSFKKKKKSLSLLTYISLLNNQEQQASERVNSH